MFDFDGYLGHNGSLPGYMSFVAFQPRQRRTIVVLTNLATPGQSPATSWPRSSSTGWPSFSGISIARSSYSTHSTL